MALNKDKLLAKIYFMIQQKEKSVFIMQKLFLLKNIERIKYWEYNVFKLLLIWVY